LGELEIVKGLLHYVLFCAGSGKPV